MFFKTKNKKEDEIESVKMGGKVFYRVISCTTLHPTLEKAEKQLKCLKDIR